MVCGGLEGGDGGGFGCYCFLFGLRFLFSVKSEGPALGRAVFNFFDAISLFFCYFYSKKWVLLNNEAA
jgi:hypothetical protein